MEEREPSFFTGLHASDFMGIGIAFMFSLGAFYLLWRMMFGPPLFEPAIQAQIKTINAMDAKNAPAPIQPDVHTGPGEVSVGITPRPQQSQKKPNSP
jgi:hypothetical protein